MPNTLTIAQAHKKLKAKEISAAELVKACISRIETVDNKINAVIAGSFDSALKKAKLLDQKGEFKNPLCGIPYLIKDNFDSQDMPSTACSNILRNKDYLPPFTATTPSRLDSQGAIGLARSNTDEFTMGSSTETSCYKISRTPWDTERVAGGSSGGSAAGVAGDETVFAIGTDTGGSIRQPAAFCGCSGIRVTYGRTSRYGAMSMASSHDTTGPLAKTAEDLAIILNAISGFDPLDATTSKNPVPDFTAALTGNIKGLKIGLPKEYFMEGIDPEVTKAIKEAAKLFKKMGASVFDVSLPYTKYAIATYYVIVPCEVSSNMARYDGIRYGHTSDKKDNLIEYYFNVRSEGFGDEVKRRIMIGTYALSAGYYDAYYRQAQKVRTLIKQDFESAFKIVDILLSPVTPTPAFKVGAHTGDPVAMYLEDIFTLPQALAGIPCLSVPCGFSENNLPIGMQLMGPQWGEEIILKAADAYQKETDWHTKKPKL